LRGPDRPDSFYRERILKGIFYVPMNGIGLRLRPAGKQPSRRRLTLLVTGALLALFVAASGKAGAQEVGAQSALSSAGESAPAVLFNEDSSSQGQEYAGSVKWRIDRIKEAGRADEIVVHADIEIPGKMKMKLDFERNADQSLPASHIVKLTFSIPQDVAGGQVVSVPGLLMKFSERGQAVPLAARTAKITGGVFLIGLSNVGPDRERNLQLLKERQWIDVAMVYGTQHCGILAIEKGYHGGVVFNEAMAAWSGLGERL
jgi:hypothetical protein